VGLVVEPFREDLGQNPVRFPVEGVDGGSISMLSVQLG
jgi:hypothetical protein